MSSVVSFTDPRRAVELDLTLEEDSDLDFPITLQNADGTDRLVTNWTAQLQVREYRDSDVILLELSTDNGKIVTSDGKITLKFAKTDIAGSWRSGVYDLKITSPASKTEWVMYGDFKITPMVTR